MDLLRQKSNLCYSRLEREEVIMETEQLQQVEVKTEPDEGLLKKMPGSKRTFDFKRSAVPALVIIVIILAGVASGYFLANRGVSLPEKETELVGGVTLVQGPQEVGIKDEELFPDTAQGRIEINDSEVVTEGSHKLIRSGGESQTAYMTSSVLDLNQFLGKCVQVWGETFKGQKAGWLMDVGRVKVLDSCPEGV